MTTSFIVILAALFIGYCAFSIPMMFQFRRYCERVAEATGRNSELHEKTTGDDNGNNAFEREQWRKLLAKNFTDLSDSALLNEAKSLSKKLRISYIYAIALVLTFALFSAIETGLI